MTLPTTGALSLSAVLTELKIANPSRAAPISLGDADVLALAGKGAPPISLSDLYGKTSFVVTGHNDAATGDSSFAGGTVVCHPSVTATGAITSAVWSFTSNPDGCTLANSTSTACTVSQSFVKNAVGSASAVLQCVVNSTFIVTGITANLDWNPY